MAFPQEGTIVTSEQTTDSTTHVISLPVSPPIGDKVQICFGIDGNPTRDWATTHSDWDEVDSITGAGGTNITADVFEREVTAGNQSDTSITITSGNAQISHAFAYPISGADAATISEGANSGVVSTATPDPPSLNPAGWDIEDTLWMSFLVIKRDAATINNQPANYGAFTELDSGGLNGLTSAICFRDLAAASEDPGTWSISPTRQSIAFTVGIRTSQGGAAQLITASAIASLEAFGVGTVSPGPVSISPSAIATLEAFGTQVLSPAAVSLVLQAINSLEAFGTQVVSPGAVTLALQAIASLEAFGSHVISQGTITIVLPAGIASAEAFGAHALSPGAVTVDLTGIATAELFGSQALATGPVSVSLPAGIASAEAFGASVISVGALSIIASAIESAEAFGTQQLITGPVTLSLAGIETAEVFGATLIRAVVTEILTPDGRVFKVPALLRDVRTPSVLRDIRSREASRLLVLTKPNRIIN